VREGFAVSLARDADTEAAIDNANPYEHTMTGIRDAVAVDRISVAFHGYAHTHLDALAHHFLGGKMYNGVSRDAFVTMSGGAIKGSVRNVKDGIFTRVCLLTYLN